MAIQILGLRDYEDSAGKISKKHVFFERDWRAESVSQLFLNYESLVKQIPEDERFNIYFTVCNCIGLAPRDFLNQNVIPFDIDNINIEKIEETLSVALKTLGLEHLKTASLFSGNGLQFFVETEVFEAGFFELNRDYYKQACKKLEKALADAGLEGKPDPSVFGPKRLMRMPGTLNRKPNKPERMARMLQEVMIPQGFSLQKLLGLPEVKSTEQIHEKFLKRFPKPDTEEVLKGCEFLKSMKAHPERVNEAQWYAGLSILGRLDGGAELAQEYSKGHPGYSHEETSTKLEQAMAASGPRTCKNISTLSEACLSCRFHNTELVTPLLIRGPNFIETEHQGFYDIQAGPNGTVRKPNYNDLLKAFKKKHDYFVNPSTKNVYVYNGQYWEEMLHNEIKNFSEHRFEPKPTEAMRSEFLAKVLANNLRPLKWTEKSTLRKINLQNGVYDIEKDELLNHSKEYFFTGILPYGYDKLAGAPKFKKFMKDVTCGKEDLEKVLLEFSGYCISGDECWIHKAMILHGEGRNGKSTFMEVLKNVVGEGLYSALSLTAIEDDKKRYMLDGKLFNVGEETHVQALSKSESFKTLVSGGELDVRRLYQQPYLFRNRAKLMFACNALPYSSDVSDGFYRRLLIIPFNAKFDAANGENKKIKQELLEELPGILNLFIDGYRRLKRQEEFSDSKTVEDELTAYRYDNDLIFSWFRDHMEETDNTEDFVSVDEMFQSFQSFCEFRKVRFTYSYSTFSKWLKKNLKDSDNTYTRRKTPGGSQKRGYVCLKLNSDF